MDKRTNQWFFLWSANGKRSSRLIGPLRAFPTKAAAWRVAETIHKEFQQQNTDVGVPTLRTLSKGYEAERLPSRSETARVYRSWLRNHILPKWGNFLLSDIKPRDVELWLRGLSLAPKTRSHLRNLLYMLFEYAMWSGQIELARNPISLVEVKGATKRVRRPRSLTVEEFRKLHKELKEPFATMALMSVCLGLRVSETLALRWSDVDWLGQQLNVERGIVKQIVDAVKTDGSRKELGIQSALLDCLKRWKQATQFSGPADWIFASSAKLGRLPYSYTGVWRELERASAATGIGHIGTHTFRHTYRSWLDAVGTPVAVQQKLRRHSDIRTTMNIYGDVVTDEMGEANRKVVELALAGSA